MSADYLKPNSPGFSRIARASIKELALEQIKRYILSGAVAPGQRLPSERDLAEQLGVGRTSVREALSVLEAVGLVEVRIGDGTYISTQSGASIGRVIGLSLAAWGGTIVEIMDARNLIEVESAGTAAERADERDLEALENEINRMEQAETFADYLVADMNFHRLVGQATHNAIVSGITTNLMDLLEQVLREIHGDELLTRAEGNATHRSVFESIRRGDRTAAAASMREHIHFSTDLWQAVVSLGSTVDVQNAANATRDR